MEAVDLAWAAGFIEGEGSVGKSIIAEKYYYIRLNAVQTNPVPLYRLQELFGGSVRERKIDNRLGSKRQWEWNVWNGGAHAAMEQMRPYFVGQDKLTKYDALLDEQAKWADKQPYEKGIV